MGIFNRPKKQLLGKLIVLNSNEPKVAEQQQRLLLEAFGFADTPATLINFPVKTSLGSQALELFAEESDTTPQARAIFLALDRREQRVDLKKQLEAGKVVLTTNYTITNAVTSGKDIEDPSDRISFFKWVHNLEHKVFGLPKPDLNIIIQQPSKEKGEADLYREISKVYPATKIIRGSLVGQSLTPREIHNAIWQLVRRVVLRNNI